jgi:large conductance mechanosensitive channel
MSLVKEFREFAIKGNVIDMAVGVIIGAAFGKIVTSVVGDIVMPPIGLAVGGVNFSNLQVVLRDAAGDKPAVILKYGAFLQNVFDFMIVAAAVFMMVRLINRLKRKEEAKPADPTPQEKLLIEIRDLLKKDRVA